MTATRFEQWTAAQLRAALADLVPPSQMPSKKAELVALADLHLGPAVDPESTDDSDSTDDAKRAALAVRRESTVDAERAVQGESTVPGERAVQGERTDEHGAVGTESTEKPEQRLMDGAEAAASVRRALPAPDDDGRARGVVDEWRAATPDPEPEAQLPALSQWQMMETMATRLARSSLIPARFFRKPDDVLIILLQAHDLGLSTSMVLSEITVIDGKPTKSAYLLRYLVRRAGHKMNLDVDYNAHGNPVAAVATCVRKDDPTNVRHIRYTIEDAQRNGLCTINDDGSVRARSGKGNKLAWELVTEDMLVARASSRACRRMFEDAIGGAAYTPEELGFVDVEGDETVPDGPGPAEPVALDALTVQGLKDRLGRLTPELREEVKVAWVKQRFPTIDALTTAHYGAIDAIIEHRERRMPEDAEVVAAASESTVVDERAADQESTVTPERPRAGSSESTEAGERAESQVSTVTPERAEALESTVSAERAALGDSTEETERPDVGVCDECGRPVSDHDPDCAAAPFT